MPKITGVKFRDTGKVYYFDPGDEYLRYHDHVIVDTARGIDYGTVVISPTDVPEDRAPSEIRKVVRKTTPDDDAHMEELRKKEKEAYRICKEKIAERGLEMKLIEAEYAFDNSKVLFYFTADGRIDFRELVKDLAGIFKTRIELRQIGVRDETKLLGGMGPCGRPLCCHTWLTEFAPVSIRMAKEQNLSLNPSKISGTCGRLMCCLKNEADTYAYLNKGMPGKGDYVTTPDGKHGDVHSVDILRQTVKVVVELDNDEKELQEFNVKDITFIPKSKKPKKDLKNQKSQKERKGQVPGKEKGELKDGSGKTERTQRPERAGKDAEVPEESQNAEARGETGKPEMSGRPGEPEMPEKPERQRRAERPGRPERSGRSARPGRPAGPGETAGSGNSGRPGRTRRQEYAERSAREDGRIREGRGRRQELAERGSRENGQIREERGQRQEKTEFSLSVRETTVEMKAEIRAGSGENLSGDYERKRRRRRRRRRNPEARGKDSAFGADERGKDSVSRADERGKGGTSRAEERGSGTGQTDAEKG